MLYCDSSVCNKGTFFDCSYTWGTLEANKWKPVNLLYVCRHCRESFKWFAVLVYADRSGAGKATKFGEIPPFGPHIPSRVISLIDPDRDLFLKGRQAETHGLGIGAFVYYRRVIENQLQRLLDEIIRVAEKLNLPQEKLKQAKSETQFAKAVETIKDAVPQALLIEGHNPITLLHKTLSKGIHELSDDEFLELAINIRLVLTEFAEKLGQALKEHARIKEALTKLFNPESRKKSNEKTKMDTETGSKSEG